jgi:hypothetical protein
VEVDELVERALKNREKIISASKEFLKGNLSLEGYLWELERFRREQAEALRRFAALVMDLRPMEMTEAVNRLRQDKRLLTLSRLASEIRTKLSERDRRLGKWASLVLEEWLKEAGELPVPIAPRMAPEAAERVPAPPAGVTKVAEPEPAVKPEPVARHEPITVSPPEATKTEVPVVPQPQMPVQVERAPRKEIDRAAIAAAVERAVGRVRRSPLEVYNDLDALLGKTLIGPEQPLVSLCWLMMSYLLGQSDNEELKELSEGYIGSLKSTRSSIVRPEVRRLAMEAVMHVEGREELRPIASFVQLYLSEAGEVKETWYRQPSS